MQKQIVKHPYINTEAGKSKGGAKIAGTRIRILDIIIEYEYMGDTPDEIINAHPHLILPQVHDALSFYYEHREDLDLEIRQRKDELKKLRKKYS